MARTGVTLLLVVLLAVFLTTSLVKGARRRPVLRSGGRGCGRQELEVRPGQEQWLVSPGHAWPGVANGSQQVCLWTLKAPPGHGMTVELVRLRLRGSRRCSGSRLQVVPGGSVSRARTRPLAKFCGRTPRNRLWKTTFSEINIEYKRNKVFRGRQEPRPSSQARAPLPKNPAAVSRAEKLKRIKALHRLYQLKTRENQKSRSRTSQDQQSDSRSQYYQYLRSLGDYPDSRRYYRHLNGSATNSSFLGAEDLMIDGDRFVYDLESNTYGVMTTDRLSTGVRLLRVGEPAWFNSEYVIHDRTNETEPRLNHYLEHFTQWNESLERDPESADHTDTSERHIDQDLINEVMDAGSDSVERHPRSPQVLRESRGHRRSQSSVHRTRYQTITQDTRSSRRQQYRVSVNDHQRRHHKSVNSPASRRALHTSHSRSRGRNEIIPNKPSKPGHGGGSHELKKFGYKSQNKSPGTQERREESHRGGGGGGGGGGEERRRRKGEYFVLKVSAFRSGCGGEEEDVRGSFSSPDYPSKTGKKGSCLWRFNTPAKSHWKLICRDFQIRKSRDCRRDHLALRINEGHWSRYCGREGPSLALTSSHRASVDVVLNTFRNRSARVMCSWETTLIDSRSSSSRSRPFGSYDRYWSYNLTRSTTSTTTTTTTTTTVPPPIVPQTRSCHDYTHLTHDHTMCRSTPRSCSIYQEGVRTSDRWAILESHNKYRAKVARGEESQGLPGPQYSASDMREITWNEELAQVAQAWASACPDYHDCHDCRKLLSRNYYVGQNIFYEWSSTNAGSVWDTAVRLWYEEVKYVPNYLIKNFRSMDHAVIGHYTQLVWAETQEMGCGAAYHDCTKVFKGRSWKLKCKIYVCNYGPTGNFLDKPMYNIGPAASACPEGTRPSVKYPGLCSPH